ELEWEIDRLALNLVTWELPGPDQPSQALRHVAALKVFGRARDAARFAARQDGPAHHNRTGEVRVALLLLFHAPHDRRFVANHDLHDVTCPEGFRNLSSGRGRNVDVWFLGWLGFWDRALPLVRPEFFVEVVL